MVTGSRECEWCGRTFAGRKDKAFCDRSCANKSWYHRNRVACQCGCGALISPQNTFKQGHMLNLPRGQVALGKTQKMSNGCLEYQGGRTSDGYGIVHGNGRVHMAHRAVYEFLVGPIPHGMSVCHKCDNPPCVNVEHLFIGTHRENMADMARKGRASRTASPLGEAGPNARLTEAMVREIRTYYDNYHVPGYKSSKRGALDALARKYGVNSVQISRIVKRQAWRHVT